MHSHDEEFVEGPKQPHASRASRSLREAWPPSTGLTVLGAISLLIGVALLLDMGGTFNLHQGFLGMTASLVGAIFVAAGVRPTSPRFREELPHHVKVKRDRIALTVLVAVIFLYALGRFVGY